MEHVGPLGLDQPAVGPEDVGELECPEVVELGPAQQPIDHLVAAIAPAGGYEFLHFLGRWQNPDRVEVDPAKEFLVGARPRRADPHTVELAEDRIVDHVITWNLSRSEAWHFDQMGEPDVGHEIEVMGNHRDLAPILESYIGRRH